MRGTGSSAPEVSPGIFRQHFEALPARVYIWRNEGGKFQLIASNEEARRPFVFAARELDPSSVLDIDGQTVLFFAEYFEILKRTVENSAVIKEDRKILFRMGDLAQVVRFVFFPVGEDTAIVHVVDVTEAWRSNELVRRKERDLAEAQRLAMVGSWQLDLQTNDLSWSDEIFRMFEVDRSQFEASYEAFLNAIHPDDRDLVNATYTNSVENKQPYEIEHRLQMSDGSIKYVVERGETYYDRDGAPVRSIGTVQDVSERVEAHRELDELMQRFKALSAAAFDGVVIVDDGRIEDVAESFADDLGYRPDAMQGHPFSDFVARPFRSVVDRKLAIADTDRFECQLLRADGSAFPVQACATPIGTKDRNRQVLALRDMSERMELEREILNVGARERSKIGRDLHDRVGRLLFHASASLKDLSNELRKERSKQLYATADVMSIVQDALEQSRYLSQLLAPVGFGESTLAGALNQMVSRVNEVTSIKCSAACNFSELVDAPDFSHQLYKIAQESVNNAIKHSRAKNIRLNLYADNDLLHLEILDDGIGIASDKLRNLKSMGLNSLFYRARMIGGNVEVVPREGGGTAVYCVCPLPEERAA